MYLFTSGCTNACTFYIQQHAGLSSLIFGKARKLYARRGTRERVALKKSGDAG